MKVESISLANISKDIESYVKKGTAKENKGIYQIDMSKYKIIGKVSGDLKLKITARGASKGAIESVAKNGGEIVVVKGE